MPQPIKLSLLTLATLIAASASTAFAQTTVQRAGFRGGTNDSWQTAQSALPSAYNQLDVVTLDHPHRRQGCHIQSLTQEKLVCSRPFGKTRTYLPQQVLALILPGDQGLKLRFLIGLNSASGVAIWGTVVLVATCPACAAATAAVALVLLLANGAILIGDDQPDYLFYLAPEQQPTDKLRSMTPWPH